MNITVASLTNAGPRAVNEDFCDYWVAAEGETIACVADGLGGMGGGDVASQLAVSSFRRHLDDKDVTAKSLLDAAIQAHERIIAAQKKSDNNRMATTLTAVVLKGDKMFGVHCGDSRAVIARGIGIKRLTTDHSEGQRLFDAGKLTRKELIDYPRKHILVSALGDRDHPRVDTFVFDLQPRDRIILTTDGVHNLIFLREMRNFIINSLTPDQLVNKISYELDQRGAIDNYTIVSLFAD